MNIDNSAVEAVHAFMLAHPAVSACAIFLNYASVAVLVCGAAFFLWRRKSRELFFVLCFSAASAYLLSRIIGFIHFRPRPFITHGFIPLIAEPTTSKSFPSSHAITAFAIAFVLYRYDKKWGQFAFVVAGLIACARVLVGVHYPSDVLAGAVLGVLLSAIIYRLRKSLIWQPIPNSK